MEHFRSDPVVVLTELLRGPALVRIWSSIPNNERNRVGDKFRIRRELSVDRALDYVTWAKLRDTFPTGCKEILKESCPCAILSCSSQFHHLFTSLQSSVSFRSSQVSSIDVKFFDLGAEKDSMKLCSDVFVSFDL